LLSFAYVYFLESGLFKGLWPIQMKKFLPGSRALLETSHVLPFRGNARARTGVDRAGKGIAQISAARKPFVAKSVFQAVDAGDASVEAHQASGVMKVDGEEQPRTVSARSRRASDAKGMIHE
jgi:hypothetical protein